MYCALLLAACTRTPAADEGRASGDTAIRQRTQVQLEVDSALAAFDRGDRVAAAKRLRGAAVALRTTADAGGSGAGALRAAASDVEGLAVEVEQGRARERPKITRLLARAQLALAERHRGRARAALGADGRRAGLELALSLDHYERALVDAGLTRTPASTPRARSLRALAVSLLGGARPANAAADIDGLAAEIRRTDAAGRSGAG